MSKPTFDISRSEDATKSDIHLDNGTVVEQPDMDDLRQYIEQSGSDFTVVQGDESDLLLKWTRGFSWRRAFAVFADIQSIDRDEGLLSIDASMKWDTVNRRKGSVEIPLWYLSTLLPLLGHCFLLICLISIPMGYFYLSLELLSGELLSPIGIGSCIITAALWWLVIDGLESYQENQCEILRAEIEEILVEQLEQGALGIEYDLS